MKTTQLVVAAMLALTASIAGCAAEPDSTHSGSGAQNELVAQKPDQQVIPFQTAAAREARVLEFTTRNAGFRPTSLPSSTPAPTLDFQDVYVNWITGGVQSMSAPGTLGPRVSLSSAQAVQIATEFLRFNKDLLALDEGELAAATVSATPYPTPSANVNWTVNFTHVASVSGYESFDTVARKLAVSVSLGQDGLPRSLYNSTHFLPGLSVANQPHLTAEDPLVISGIVGQTLEWKPISFVPEPTVIVGPIVAADIVSRTPTIHVQPNDGAMVLTLAYDVRVQRDGHEWAFFVHHRTGKVIQQQQRDSL